MKKTVIFILIFSLLFALSGCVAIDNDTESVKVGVLLPFSGQNAIYGQSGRRAIELLQKEFNDKGGINGQKVRFIYSDDEGKPASSVLAAQKLITAKNVVALVGPLTSTCANSVAPIAQHYNIPMVTGTATNERVTEVGDCIFRTCFLDAFQGTMSAKFATETLKAKTAAVLYNNGDDYSNGLAENFIKGFESHGGIIIDTEIYNTGDKDFSAQLTKLATKGPDVILLPDYYATVSIIALQARSVGIKSVFIGGDGWQSNDLFKLGDSAVEGAYFTTHFSPDDTAKEVQTFVKEYKEAYEVTPDAMSVLNYDAAKVLLLSIEKAGSLDANSIKAALKEFNGTVVSGHITFDEKRNAVKSIVIVKTEDAKEKFFKKLEP